MEEHLEYTHKSAHVVTNLHQACNQFFETNGIRMFSHALAQASRDMSAISDTTKVRH